MQLNYDRVPDVLASSAVKCILCQTVKAGRDRSGVDQAAASCVMLTALLLSDVSLDIEATADAIHKLLVKTVPELRKEHDLDDSTRGYIVQLVAQILERAVDCRKEGCKLEQGGD